MPSRLAVSMFVAAAAIARPCVAQQPKPPQQPQQPHERVVSNHAPLSPEDAVSVLRSSRSLSDMANRPVVDPDGPHVYVLPYDRSDVPPPVGPADPLGRDMMPYGGGYMDGLVPYASYGGYGMPYGSYGGYAGTPFNGYAPFNGFAPFNGYAPFNRMLATPGFRGPGHLHPMTVGPRPFPTPSPLFPGRHVVIGAAPSGIGASAPPAAAPARRR